MKRKLKVLINNLYFQLVVILILLLVVILILLFIAFLVFQNNQTILMTLATMESRVKPILSCTSSSKNSSHLTNG